nr:carbohydrate ABC transporter permease [Deinobacterium chartae]
MAAIKRRKRARAALTNALVYAVLTVIAVVAVYPFWWTAITSVEPAGPLYEFPPKLWPEGFTLRHYEAAFSSAPLAKYFLNSVIVSFFGVILSVILAALAAYPLAKMRFWGRDVIFFTILATLVLPNEAGLIVNYITTVKLGLLQSSIGEYVALFLPSIASTVGLFLMRQAYLSIPTELIEAARIDGASELTVWWRVMLPLTKPTLAAFSILQFVGFWNSFLWAIIILNDREKYPIAAGLLDLSGQFATNTRAVAAGTVITMIPVILVFLFAQRYFMKGLEGAVKG